MLNRRIYETVGIRYADVSQMATIVADIRAMLENHEDIEPKQTLIVNFQSFGASSLDIMVYTFTKTVDWVTFHNVKQDVLLKISDVIEQHGAEIAFPTRTLHLAEGARLDGAGHEKGSGANGGSRRAEATRQGESAGEQNDEA